MRKQLGLVVGEEFVCLAENAAEGEKKEKGSELCDVIQGGNAVKSSCQDASLVQRQPHWPEVTNGDFVNHSLRGGTLQALHGVLHRLLGFGQILHLRRE